ANEDDALLFWSIAKPIADCRGFAIERRKGKGAKQKQEFLPNRIGFENENVAASVDEERDQQAPSNPSSKWPVQRFSVTDHDANKGDGVSYRVVPVVRKGDELELVEAQASEWSEERKLGEMAGSYRPFFNRGFVMSQFMARYLAENKLTLKEF